MRALFLAAVVSLMPALATAQSVTVNDCEWRTMAENIPEPWEDYTRTFSNGQTRLAMLDLIEPARGYAWLMVLSPPERERGGRQCKVLGLGGMGFAGMDFSTLTADYDPATGLAFSLTIEMFNPDDGTGYPAALWFNLNQATGEINAVVQSD